MTEISLGLEMQHDQLNPKSRNRCFEQDIFIVVNPIILAGGSA
jgi:hypothetical protein